MGREVLAGTITSRVDTAMVTLPTLWGRLMRDDDLEQLRAAVAEAQALDAALLSEIDRLSRLATPTDQSTFLRMLVTAWPNASQNDLAGYGLQLAQDVAEEAPSVYAVHYAGRHLRRTLKFVPSISEVLEAIGEAEKRMGSVVKTLPKIPEALERAKIVLGRPSLRIAGGDD